MADNVDPMWAVYFLLIYFGIATVFGFVASFIAEYHARSVGFHDYCYNLAEWKRYYFSFVAHVLDEATSLSSMIAMYCVCQDLYGTDVNEWKLLTRQPTPAMLLLISVIIWSLYKLLSTLYLINIDIFSWMQVLLHLIDCNYLYEMFIAHSENNKNPIIQWMHRQYIYLCSIPLWFCNFVFLVRWSEIVFTSTNSPAFVCLLLSNLFGLLNIFPVLLWCDARSFNSDSQDWTDRGYRLRVAYRFCQFLSRMVWLSYFWIFVGTPPFFIFCLLLLLNHLFLYFKGYFAEFYYVITKFFIVPDMSAGIGFRNQANHGKVDWFTKIVYISTHCAGCMIGIVAVGDGDASDMLYIDMLSWLHWFEDLVLWAVLTGICDQQPEYTESSIMSPAGLRDAIWTQRRYEAFYALGIICWFFSGCYFLVLRFEDFLDRNNSSLSITQGILGLAASGQWDSLDKFLPRMKKMSINRSDALKKTALHYAIEQDKWSVVKKLLQYGANVNLADRNHQSAVHLVCKSKTLTDMELFKQFLDAFDGDPATKRDNNGRTILHLMCQNASEQRLRFYFDLFVNNENSDKNGKNHKIDVNVADNDGCTPLHYLVEDCNEQNAIEFLLDAGAEIDIQDNQKRTPLIHAVRKAGDNLIMIRYLLMMGANVNHQDDKGWTALHFACSEGLVDKMYVLFEKIPELDITIRNNAGKNAYNLAESKGYEQIAGELKLNMMAEDLKELNPVEMEELRRKRELEKKKKAREQEERQKENTLHTNNKNTISVMEENPNRNSLLDDQDEGGTGGDNKEEEEEQLEVVVVDEEKNTENDGGDAEKKKQGKDEEEDDHETEPLLHKEDLENPEDVEPDKEKEKEEEEEEENTTTAADVAGVNEEIVKKVSEHIELNGADDYHD